MLKPADELIHVIGGGLAGSEAAWQAAEAGAKVILHEMRPLRPTDAHQTEGLAELVCSNSFRSDDFEHNAVGLLHEEMRRCGSLILGMADKHKLLVGYHGHDATNDPNQTATLESYDTLMAYGKYNGVNLDIGHFTAAGYDAVAFIKQHHAKITNLHIKDRKKDHGPNVAVWVWSLPEL